MTFQSCSAHPISRHLVIGMAVLAGLVCSPVRASSQEHEPAVNKNLIVQVRTIRALGMFEEAEREKQGEQSIDEGIADLRPQLHRVNYSAYRLLEQREIVIAPRKKETISLMGGHTLTVRPLGIDGDKICVWLKWRDKSGMEMLDTRMRFVAGESMLTGTEHSSDTGMILAISLRPVE